MFARNAPKSYAQTLRLAMEPLAEECGVDYDESAFRPAIEDADRAFEMMMIGASLVLAFTYVDAWPSAKDGIGGSSKKERVQAARLIEDVVTTDYGRDGISVMAQSFALATADAWTRAADQDEYVDERESLLASAAISRELAALAQSRWTVSDEQREAPRAAVRRAFEFRDVDLDNPHAMIDLRSDAERAHATAEALLISAGPLVEKIEDVVLGPVRTFHMVYSACVQADWIHNAKVLRNLMSDSPLPRCELFDQLEAEQRMA